MQFFRDKAKGRETLIERQSKENERKNTNRQRERKRVEEIDCRKERKEEDES